MGFKDHFPEHDPGYIGSPEGVRPMDPDVDQAAYAQFLEEARVHAREGTSGATPVAFDNLGSELTEAVENHQVQHPNRTQRAIDSMGSVLRIMLGRR